jgi:hypothetical protein
MPWTQTDTSFKKLSNKRVTTSVGKGLPEEKGASTLELYLPDIKTGLIPGTGYAGYGVSGNLFYYGPTAAFGQTLAVDTSVPGNLTWFATSGWGNTTVANDGTAGSEAQRLGDWVSDKYDAFGTVPGAGYEIKVFDRNNNLITKSDSSNWLFDYQTGILVFNQDTTSISTLISTSGPFKIVGWRYIGPKGIIPASNGGLGFTSYNLGDLIVGAGTTIIPFPVGTNSYILSVDSSASSGLSWIPNTGGGGSGISSLNNLTSGEQYFATGISGVGFNISSSGSTHTFNIPIAGIGFTGLITGTAQTIDGSKTFTSDTIFSSSTVSTSTSTGALIVSGGVGIGGSLFVTSSLPSSISGIVANNGVITSGSWAGSLITGFYGGTGYNSYTKGDILVGSGNTFVKLSVGSDNFILAADNSTPSGLRWIANSGGGGTGVGTSVYIAETPPPYTSNAGDLWYNSENGALNIYYVDVDTSQWVEINSAFGGVDPPNNIGTGITQLNGLGASSQFLYAGFNGNTFNISSAGNGHTFNIPIAGVGITGLVSGFAQTFGGVKTFQDGLISGNGVTIYGSLSLPNQPLLSVYGGTGKTSYNLGDLLVGAGTSIISLPQGANGYVLQSNTSFQSGLGWTYVSNVNVSETAPLPAITGDLWWNSIDGSLSVYFVDVDSTSQWVEIGNGPSQGSAGSTTVISASYFLASYGYLETVYDYGTSSGSITPNWNDGSIQKIILNGGLSLNVPINMQSGSSLKLIVRQNASGNHTLTPNASLKFKGGNKTLSTSANSIDMIKIYYDGTNYLCDLDLAYS